MTDIILTPPQRQEAMQLSDGRVLAWYEWGPPDGVPVLFCTGAAMSGWLGFGTDCVDELGLRLIAPDRPGLGRSSPDPHKSLSTWAEDVRVLCAHMDSTEVLAVGFSQGAPFALALTDIDAVAAVAIVAGQDQLTHPRIRPLLHPDVAGMLATLEADRAGFEEYVATSANADWLWDLIMGMSGERDRAIYQSPAFAQAYRESLRQGFAAGAHGYARDLVVALGPWPVTPEDVTVPVDLWYGLEDTSTVHSPDFGETLASRLQWATRQALPNEGGSILWTSAKAILTQLKSHISSA